MKKRHFSTSIALLWLLSSSILRLFVSSSYVAAASEIIVQQQQHANNNNNKAAAGAAASSRTTTQQQTKEPPPPFHPASSSSSATTSTHENDDDVAMVAVADHQADPRHGPTKATDAQWSENVYDDHTDNGWRLSHEALRHELDSLTKAVDAVVALLSSSSWSNDKDDNNNVVMVQRSFQSIWRYHYDHLLAHQQAEDALYFPFLRRRIRFPDAIASQHVEIERAAKVVDEMVTVLTTTTNEKDESSLSSSCAPVVPSSLLYDLAVKVHALNRAERSVMGLEERLVLPCRRSYFTRAELSHIEYRTGRAGGHGGSFVHVIGADTFRQHTMPRQGIPWFVWNLVFRSHHAQYQEQVVQPVEELQRRLQQQQRPPR